MKTVQAAILEILEANDGFCMDDPGERELLAKQLKHGLKEYLMKAPDSKVAATCDHSGIGLPGCEVCDMTTDKNQDRRRRGESPVCIDCGGEGELVGAVEEKYFAARHCVKCDVTFGWMVPMTNTMQKKFHLMSKIRGGVVGPDYVSGLRDAVLLIEAMGVNADDTKLIAEHLRSVADTIEKELPGVD